MRRKSILVAAAVVILIAAAYVYRNRPSFTLAPIDPDAPTHYFIAADATRPRVELCDFTLDLDRENSHDMWNLRLQPCTASDGWVIPGDRGVQASARRSTLEFFSEHTDWTHLILRARAMPAPSDQIAQTTRVSVNGTPIGEVVIPESTATLGIEIPPGHVQSGVNTISLSFAYRTLSPGKSKRSVQPKFAITLLKVALAKFSAEKSPTARAFRRALDKAAVARTTPSTQIYDHDIDRFVVTGPGTLVMPETLAANAERLEIEVVESGTGDHTLPQISVQVLGLNSGRVRSRELTQRDESGEGVYRSSINVKKMAGETCVISLDVRPENGATAVEIQRPRTVVRVEPAAGERQPGEPQRLPPAKPDIVLITLDAARPHHFSCYGYHRRTTPNIDRLAQESLVFLNAFALVPNTRRSVPTMVTGLSLLNHQVLHDDSALAPEAVTLAEYLHDAGYATAAFSSSPNNSRAVGTDQGYEEFVELWNELKRHKSRRPDYLARRAIDWLEEQDDERPLHLQLHFVPPHAPYQPLPKFDRFSDPEYTGIFDGSTDSIFTFDQRHQIPTTDDLSQAVALYDGNLRAGDDAVAEVFGALKARGRWDNTVILVTSDHGEAFYEHHRMSHNNTVYDEMLRVPFILRLPEGFDRGGLDLDRMVTLADIVPTLLATASLEPDAILDGFNLPFFMKEGN